jgi:tetratricopeptide (TPR) repeat protein
MNSFSRSVVMVFLFSSGLTIAHAQTSDSELRLGVAAYKNSQYDESIQHFQKAVELDSGNIKARMYLATAYLSEFIPGVDSGDNKLIAERAVEQYQQVLSADSSPEQRLNSAKGIAYVRLNLKEFEVAKTYYLMASDLDPNDPEPHYSIGVIDWTLSYQPRIEARSQLGLKPEDHLDAKVPTQERACDELNEKSGPTIENGIESLNKAIQLRPDYDDAMAYMNLMYRERADLECDDLAARERDLKTADHWVDMTLRVKKQKAEKSKALAPPAPATAPNPQ